MVAVVVVIAVIAVIAVVVVMVVVAVVAITVGVAVVAVSSRLSPAPSMSHEECRNSCAAGVRVRRVGGIIIP
jgi:hypothetical protein